jgi:hypothetical protein
MQGFPGKKTITELLEHDLLACTIPDTARNSLQKYRMTEAGLSLLTKANEVNT